MHIHMFNVQTPSSRRALQPAAAARQHLIGIVRHVSEISLRVFLINAFPHGGDDNMTFTH